jgi:hypothetical protein
LVRRFDILQIAALVIADKADRDAVRTRTRGAADAVDILVGHIGQLVIEHMADAGDVDTARGDIGRDQHLQMAVAETLHRGGALALALVAMDRGGLDACARQMADNAVGTMFGAGEDQRAVDASSFRRWLSKRLLFALVDKGHILLDAFRRGRRRGYRNADRIVEETVAQFGNRLGHGGREKQALALFGEQQVDPLERVDEAKVHHLVGFVEDEDLDILQAQRALFDQVEQAARRGDKDVGAGLQLLLLREDRHPAEDALDGQAQIFAIVAELFRNLRGEFARRRQHQHPAAIRHARFDVGGEMVERGQRERRRLAGSGLRDTAQIAPFEQRRDRLRLDRGRAIISRLGKRLQDIGWARPRSSK